MNKDQSIKITDMFLFKKPITFLFPTFLNFFGAQNLGNSGKRYEFPLYNVYA